jgi:predicted ferric reductase
MSKTSVLILFLNPLLSGSQLFALLGTTLLAYSFFLSSRFKILEKLHGGLDKVYKFHHIVGILAFILLLEHPLFLAIGALPDKLTALNFIIPINNLVNMIGFIAIAILLFLMFVTLYIKLPYHIWKITHEYMGLPLLLGLIHVFLVSSDVSRYLPLRIFMLSIISGGIFMYIYKRFLYNHFQSKHLYRVDQIIKQDTIIDIVLIPLGKPLTFRAGQFVFAKFDQIGDNQSHPFSISSHPSQSKLRLSIKILGDHTNALKNLKTNTLVQIWGPYGTFSEKFFTGKPAILVAGGIGITPFLSMIKAESETPLNRQISLYYSTSTQNESVYDEEIKNIISECRNIKYTQNISKKSGRLTARRIFSDHPDINKTNIYLCGPLPMMLSLRDGLMKLGVKQYKIYFEDFSII